MDKNLNQFLISLHKELKEKNQNHEAIINFCNEILKLTPKDQDALKCKIIAMLKMEQYQNCQQILKEDIALNDPELAYYYAFILFKAQKFQQILSFIEKIPEAQQQTNYGLLLLKAQSLEKLKKYIECHQVYFMILEKFPNVEETEEIIANLFNISFYIDQDQNKEPQKKFKNHILQFAEKYYKNKYYLREVLINQSFLLSQRKNFAQSNECLNKVLSLILTEGPLEKVENQSYTDYVLCHLQLDYNQNQSKGYTKEELIERINLYQQFLDNINRIVDANLINMLKHNLQYLGQKLFATSDSTRKEDFDEQKIQKILKEYPDLIQFIKDQSIIDNLLTDLTIFKQISKKPIQQTIENKKQTTPVAPIKKAIQKKRKHQIRYPKNYDPNNPKANQPLDADRWVNRFQKHGMKNKKNKKNQFRGPQGMVDERMEGATMTAGPVASTISKEVSSSKARKDKKRKNRV